MYASQDLSRVTSVKVTKILGWLYDQFSHITCSLLLFVLGCTSCTWRRPLNCSWCDPHLFPVVSSILVVFGGAWLMLTHSKYFYPRTRSVIYPTYMIYFDIHLLCHVGHSNVRLEGVHKLRLQDFSFFDHLPPSSCKRSLWTPPWCKLLFLTFPACF